MRLSARGLHHYLPASVRRSGRATIRAYAQATAGLRPYPDFLFIGTKRGGTTTMWNHLLEHPLILPMVPRAAKIKSPAYFWANFDRGPIWYRSHFPSYPYRSLVERLHGQPPVSGDASPYYLYDPRVPARVRDLVPEVKVLVLLRNPVDRAYSHYRERVNAGVEPLTFEGALAAEPARLRGELEKMAAAPGYYSTAHDFFSYRDRGIYQPQLERWLAKFPRSQMLILRSEDLYVDAQTVLDRVTNFLGLPSQRIQHRLRYNHHPAVPMAESTRWELEQFFRPYNEALYRYLGVDFGWEQVTLGPGPDGGRRSCDEVVPC